MRNENKLWQNIAGVVILLVIISLLFGWYSATNKQHIETQNLNYAMDSAQQTAKRIEGEFANARQRVRNYIYFLDTSLDEPAVSAQRLLEMEQISAFDALRFVNADGLNLASSGQTADSSDRGYFIRGMEGESGVEMVFDSRLTSEKMMVFYAPLHRDGEIFGLLLGLYFAEDYLQDMLDTSYFGEPADVFLCAKDGRVIASSDDLSHDGLLVDEFLAQGVVDGQTADGIREIFLKGEGEASFICTKESSTDNLCVIFIPDSDFVLVQAFPQSVTTAMVNEANYAGVVLQATLIGMFLFYILFLMLQGRWKRLRLEKENREMGYIISGVTTLFSRFAMVDLENGTYRYLAETQPEDGGGDTGKR